MPARVIARHFHKTLFWIAAFTIGQTGVAEENSVGTCSTHDLPTVEFFLQTLPTSEPFPVTVPIAFFDRTSRAIPGSTRDAMLLDIDLRGFAPWKGGVLENHLGMLVTEYVDLSEIAQNRAENQTGVRNANTEYPTGPGPFELKELVFERGQTVYDDASVFVAFQSFSTDDPNGTTDVIVCIEDGEVPYPSCQHYIDVPLADIKIRYRREHLPDWATLSRQVREFWECSTSLNVNDRGE